MMSQFLVADDSDIPAEPDMTDDHVETEIADDEALDLLSEVYRVLRDLCEKIERTIGEG